MLERLFQLEAHNTSVRNEIIGGITTFLTMAYIIFVNPAMLAQAVWIREPSLSPPALQPP